METQHNNHNICLEFKNFYNIASWQPKISLYNFTLFYSKVQPFALSSTINFVENYLINPHNLAPKIKILATSLLNIFTKKHESICLSG